VSPSPGEVTWRVEAGHTVDLSVSTEHSGGDKPHKRSNKDIVFWRKLL
jgi:hypothetical protein